MAHVGGKPCPLLQLNLDVLICIASSLDLTSLSRLSQTCHSLHEIVEDHGWKSLWLRSASSSSTGGDEPILNGKAEDTRSKYKRYLQIDKAWATKAFRCSQSRLPTVTAGGGKAEKHQPQPLLLLTPIALLLFTGSEMRLWSRSILQNEGPVQLSDAQLFYLDNPAGLDSKRRPGTAPLALWDICASTQLDMSGEYIALGRLNGMVEIIRLSTAKQNARQKGRVLVNLVWLWRDSSSIQAIHACPSSGLLAIASKSGSIALFKVTILGRRGLKVRLIEQWSIGNRPWSVHVHGNQWLAVGASDIEPILLYPLQEGSHIPKPPFLLSAGSAKAISVYALQTKVRAGKCVLLAGCYDGVLRSYDIDSILSDGQEGDKALLPQSQMRDRFDPSAIYCLCTGFGQRGEDVAAGTARHGVCKVFRSTMVESDSYSMFAAQSSQSPTYSVVGQYDRLFGVTDAMFWEIDVRFYSSRLQTAGKSYGQQDRQNLAFYRHGDMILESSL